MVRVASGGVYYECEAARERGAAETKRRYRARHLGRKPGRPTKLEVEDRPWVGPCTKCARLTANLGGVCTLCL